MINKSGHTTGKSIEIYRRSWAQGLLEVSALSVVVMRLCARGKVEIYSRLTMPAGFTDQQTGGTRATTINFWFSSAACELTRKQHFSEKTSKGCEMKELYEKFRPLASVILVLIICVNLIAPGVFHYNNFIYGFMVFLAVCVILLAVIGDLLVWLKKVNK